MAVPTATVCFHHYTCQFIILELGNRLCNRVGFGAIDFDPFFNKRTQAYPIDTSTQHCIYLNTLPSSSLLIKKRNVLKLASLNVEKKKVLGNWKTRLNN